MIAEAVRVLFVGLAFLLLGSGTPYAAAPVLSSGASESASVASGTSWFQSPTGPDALEPEALPPDEARLINEHVPFASVVGPVARPFIFAGSALSRDRAIDCLASAMWYEAGEGEEGQLAVAQVVLNRVRHPAFPNTVCGVVFQGSERRTGCQFTFTCDGALSRRPSAAAFLLAERRAMAMLYGVTFARVGLATHYHTDWVHPAWSAQMDKLSQVDTHLFFRWRGAWGQPGTMRQTYGSEEPKMASLAFLSAAHRDEERPDFASAFGDLGAPVQASDGSEVPAIALSAASYSLPKPSLPKDIVGPLDVNLPASLGGDGTPQALGAISKCGVRDFCKLVGHVDGDKSRIAFLYVRDRRGRVERAYWDCDIFPRSNRSDCLTSETRGWLRYGPAGSDRPQSPIG